MHIVINKSVYGKAKQIYHSILLRQSYREGSKVRKRTIANLSHCSPNEIEAMRLALKYKDELTILGSLKESVELQEGLSVGAVWIVYQIAKRLGIEKALGYDFAGKLALWQIMARVINQGSRLSAVRLAQTHAVCDVLDIKRGFDENDLYDNLSWIAKHQEKIERNLFLIRRGEEKPKIFLYDVTSSYLEGEKNAFADYGYSRDRKKGKKQLVIGLLCDEFGQPVSTEVFSGNTQDAKTFYSQVRKVAEKFGCKDVVFVGDKGMIKTTQINSLPEGFHYITSITKPQIESLIREGVIQIGLFEDNLCEIEDENEGVRYILRRNPYRAKEVAEGRLSKQRSIEKFVDKKNKYLEEHAKAKESIAVKDVNERIKKLKIENWLKVEVEGRRLKLRVEKEALDEESLLDGCYVIKTDVSREMIDKKVIHARYKDLAIVEQAFRTCKTELLEVRPVYVRTEDSTRGHIIVVMLAYMIIRYLKNAWLKFDLTVKEALNQLSTLCSMEIKVTNQSSCLKIPRPREMSKKLLEALNISLPIVLPHRKVRVVTRKNLVKHRKSA